MTDGVFPVVSSDPDPFGGEDAPVSTPDPAGPSDVTIVLDMPGGDDSELDKQIAKSASPQDAIDGIVKEMEELVGGRQLQDIPVGPDNKPFWDKMNELRRRLKALTE